MIRYSFIKLRAIRDDKLHILTHPNGKAWVQRRMEDILEERNPTFDPAALGLPPEAVKFGVQWMQRIFGGAG